MEIMRLLQMISSFVSELKAAASDPDCAVVAVTGTGDFFTSGNDLSNFMNKKLVTVIFLVHSCMSMAIS